MDNIKDIEIIIATLFICSLIERRGMKYNIIICRGLGMEIKYLIFSRKIPLKYSPICQPSIGTYVHNIYRVVTSLFTIYILKHVFVKQIFNILIVLNQLQFDDAMTKYLSIGSQSIYFILKLQKLAARGIAITFQILFQY